MSLRVNQTNYLNINYGCEASVILGFGKLIFQLNKSILWVLLSDCSFQASSQTWISLSSRDLNEFLMMEDSAKLKVASLYSFCYKHSNGP